MKVTMIILDHCPYCKRARRLIEEMKKENPAYEKFEFELVNEENPGDKLKGLEYYYVPTFFHDGEKLYEASPGDEDEIMKPKLEAMFKRLEEKHQ